MYCIEKILAGEKTVTRRMITSNRRPAVPGKMCQIPDHQRQSAHQDQQCASVQAIPYRRNGRNEDFVYRDSDRGYHQPDKKRRIDRLIRRCT